MTNQLGGVSYWKTVPDDEIMMVWCDSEGTEHFIPPTFYAESGTPVCPHSGDDMEYIRTEIKMK